LFHGFSSRRTPWVLADATETTRILERLLYIERLLDRASPWTKMRQAHQLLRLCRKYRAERVDAVCKSSLEFDVVDVPRVERMLKNAQKIEQLASDSGKLRALPTGRFARSSDSFSTRGSSEKGGV
jgi:hypothetical protein